jgi:hypothetical protein
MTQDVYATIITPYFKVTMVWGQPTVNHLVHFYLPLSERKSPGCFFSPIASVAFNTDAHILSTYSHLL